MQRVPFATVNVFASALGEGNPAGVVRLARLADLSSKAMQRVAAEIGFTATAFVAPTAGRWDIRWFSATSELSICGHATIGAARLLLDCGVVAPITGCLNPSNRLHFHAKTSGHDLFVSGGGSENHSQLSLILPSEPARADAVRDRNAVIEALRVPASSVRFVGANSWDTLVELDSAGLVEALEPCQKRLAELPTRGVIATAAGTSARCPEAQFVSRFFAPSAGIPEDPATGSAQCALGPYWSAALEPQAEGLVGFQASRRGGRMYLRMAEQAICHEKQHGTAPRPVVRLTADTLMVMDGTMATGVSSLHPTPSETLAVTSDRALSKHR